MIQHEPDKKSDAPSKSHVTTAQGGAFLALLAALTPLPSLAQTVNWTGSQSSSWNVGANWSSNSVPQSGSVQSLVSINNSVFNPVSAEGITFSGGALNIGSAADSTGALRLVDGASFELNRVYIGSSGIGTLEIVDSTLISGSTVEVGSSGHGSAIISGRNASLSITGLTSHLNIGNRANGDGHVDIRNGAKVTVANVSLGNLNGSGSLKIDGRGSALTINGRDLSAAGRTGDVWIQVSNGGEIEINGDGNPDSRGLLQLGSNGGSKTELFLTGEGSQITTTGNGLIGEFGVVSAKVDDQALMKIGNHLIIGDGRSFSYPTGEMTIDRRSEVRVAGDTVIGAGSGSGTLKLSGASTLTSGGDVYIAMGSYSKGVLDIGASTDDPATAAGVLNASAVYFGTGDGKLVFNHTASAGMAASIFAQTLYGPGRIENYAGFTHLTATDNSSFTGSTTIYGGTMRIDGVLGGVMNVDEVGRLQGIGTVGTTLNRGTIAPGNSIGVLTIAGNYTGDGGLLEIETVLGDDSSPSDGLVIEGDTSGQTRVVVANRGGIGAPTVEGIKVIQVDGASNGIFTLVGDYNLLGQPAVVAGAYAYTLQKNGVSTPIDGGWYLRSSLTPTPPVPQPEPSPPPTPTPTPAPTPEPQPILHPGAALYETMPRVALALMGLQTLQQRVGNRYWQGESALNGASDASGTATGSSGFWGRMDGAFARADSGYSTSGARVDQRQWRSETGFDFLAWSGASGSLVGSVNLHYGRAFADITSPWGRGRNQTTGYGLGASATWYGKSGLYADAQGRLTWFDTEVTSHTLGRKLADGVKGFGRTLSLEVGHRLHLSERLVFIPQTQMTWAGVNYDRFLDPYDASVSARHSQSLQGRIGLALQHEQSWTDAIGNLKRTSLYGIGNLYHEFLDGTSVSLAGLRLHNEEARTWAGVGLGGSYNLNGDAVGLYGEIQAAANVSGRGESYRLSGKVGLRMKW